MSNKSSGSELLFLLESLPPRQLPQRPSASNRRTSGETHQPARRQLSNPASLASRSLVSGLSSRSRLRSCPDVEQVSAKLRAHSQQLACNLRALHTHSSLRATCVLSFTTACVQNSCTAHSASQQLACNLRALRTKLQNSLPATCVHCVLSFTTACVQLACTAHSASQHLACTAHLVSQQLACKFRALRTKLHCDITFSLSLSV